MSDVFIFMDISRMTATLDAQIWTCDANEWEGAPWKADVPAFLKPFHTFKS